jgi:hypothetical protein
VLSGAREAEADAGWIAGRSGLEDVRMMEVQEGEGEGVAGDERDVLFKRIHGGHVL